ncbi:MAG: hypothetical protein Q9181_001411 [Wetmoreana brouardii]
MSSLYNLEPQPTAKVLLETTSGDILLELFVKQTPLASRNFLQLCVDGYYNNTIFHRLVPGFVIQGGDPTGTGEGGEAIYDGGSFEDEFHSRLKFNRRGLLGMANSGGKNDNGSQFFLTLGATPELEGRNTMFGRVAGDTIYNLMKIGEAELIAEGSERPLYPTKVTGAEILVNPFEDMVRRNLVQTKNRQDVAHKKDAKKQPKKKGRKILLSFGGDEAEEGNGTVPKKEKFNPQLVSGDASDHVHTTIRAGQEVEPSGTGSGTMTKPIKRDEKPREKPIRQRPTKSVSPPSPQTRDPATQLPLPMDEEPSRSPSPSPEPDHVGKVSSLLDRTNAQIAELKASMKRNIASAPATEKRKQSALEQMIPETATRGRKRKHAANGDTQKDQQSLDILRAFRAKLESAPPETKQSQTPALEDNGSRVEVNGSGATNENDEDEAALCDLHFIANCQSCQSWDKHEPEDAVAGDEDDKGWMSHALNFDKDRLGKDLNWKSKNEEELVVIDPREKAKDLKEEQRAKRQRGVGGGGRAWDRDRDKGRVPERMVVDTEDTATPAVKSKSTSSTQDSESFIRGRSSGQLTRSTSTCKGWVAVMLQAGSRKRPAPGASPVTLHSQTPIGPNLNPPQMSSNQYLQWNQANQPPTPPSYPNLSATYPQIPPSTAPPQQSASSQLTQRPPVQSIAERPPYANSNADIWPSLAGSGIQQLSDAAWGNNGDDLDRKALAAQRDSQAKRKQIPPFVQKLSSFLDESRNTDLIRWSESGDSFIVIDEEEFARTLIPELFKHKNYASFVRQLNMYGFHKKVGLSDNSMRASERKNKSPSEYYNPYFKRGRPNLLWLIHKPKNVPSRATARGNKARQEDGNPDEDVEELCDMDQPSTTNQTQVDALSMRQGRQPLMLSNGGASNTPQDLAAVHQELQTVRKQQQMIANLLQKTRAEHEQLYGQAANFQKLHDRHESSINAILTFLATVYNRSLEDKGGQNFGGMFGSISPTRQGQGNVVDVGEVGDQNMVNGQQQTAFRRQPLLLAAPPGNQQRVSVVSPAASANSPADQTQSLRYEARSPVGIHSPAAQEVLDTPSNRSSQSPQIKAEAGNNGQPSEADIMSVIQSTNAMQPYYDGSRMDFPEALSHLQTADGQSPLTPNQRSDALRLIAGNVSANSSENALTTPSPSMPTMAQYQQSKERLDQLSNALKEQDNKVNQLSNVLAPLSPSGSIPGITDGQGYGDPGSNEMLDLDQIFNSGDYFNENATADFDFGSNEPLPEFNFDTTAATENAGGEQAFGFDGAGDEGPEGSTVETVNSSEATSPANTVDEDNAGQEERTGSGKRRRKG